MNHPELAAEFVKNDARAHWHDQALWFVRARRDKAAQQVPEWEWLRETASRIKAHTLAHLAEYLEQFESQAIRLGTGKRLFVGKDLSLAERLKPNPGQKTSPRMSLALDVKGLLIHVKGRVVLRPENPLTQPPAQERRGPRIAIF